MDRGRGALQALGAGPPETLAYRFFGERSRRRQVRRSRFGFPNLVIYVGSKFFARRLCRQIRN